jgi:glycosyltransferase involved in cell wall biosynthesis
MVTSEPTRASFDIGKPWRILHTESSLELGGQEYRVLDEAWGMKKRGHKVILAIPKGSKMTFLAQQKELSVVLTASGKVAWLSLVSTYWRIIQRHRIQIVNTHGSLDSWTASIASRLSPFKPIIIRTRHKSTPISQSWRHQWLYKHLPHGVMTTSERIRKNMITSQRLDPIRTCSVPTGVNFGIFNRTKMPEDLRKEFGFDKDSIVLGTVAFLRDYKGIHLCLDAVALLRQNFPSIKLLVAGDGPEGIRLQEKAQVLGIQDNVYFAGFRPDVHRVLATLNLFVLPSTAGEGVPQAITQAMAMGIPVVATSIGGIPEVVIHEETGMLVPVNNVKTLTHCIQVVLNDRSLREKMIKKAQKLVTQFYSLEAMLDAVEEFYGEIFQTTTSDFLDGRVV